MRGLTKCIAGVIILGMTTSASMAALVPGGSFEDAGPFLPFPIPPELGGGTTNLAVDTPNWTLTPPNDFEIPFVGNIAFFTNDFAGLGPGFPSNSHPNGDSGDVVAFIFNGGLQSMYTQVPGQFLADTQYSVSIDVGLAGNNTLTAGDKFIFGLYSSLDFENDLVAETEVVYGDDSLSNTELTTFSAEGSGNLAIGQPIFIYIRTELGDGNTAAGQFIFDNVQLVPEPGSMMSLATIAAMGLLRRKRT